MLLETCFYLGIKALEKIQKYGVGLTFFFDCTSDTSLKNLRVEFRTFSILIIRYEKRNAEETTNLQFIGDWISYYPE